MAVSAGQIYGHGSDYYEAMVALFTIFMFWDSVRIISEFNMIFLVKQEKMLRIMEAENKKST